MWALAARVVAITYRQTFPTARAHIVTCADRRVGHVVDTKRTSSDYGYSMDFDGDKIRHMTKIWNAGWAMKELGWG
jgi:hypothetical protein